MDLLNIVGEFDVCAVWDLDLVFSVRIFVLHYQCKLELALPCVFTFPVFAVFAGSAVFKSSFSKVRISI